MSVWFLYIVQCRDQTLYTGISTDVDRRVRQHNDGAGAKYTRSRRPVQLLCSTSVGTRSQASKYEYQVKCLSRVQKLALIDMINRLVDLPKALSTLSS